MQCLLHRMPKMLDALLYPRFLRTVLAEEAELDDAVGVRPRGAVACVRVLDDFDFDLQEGSERRRSAAL